MERDLIVSHIEIERREVEHNEVPLRSRSPIIEHGLSEPARADSRASSEF